MKDIVLLLSVCILTSTYVSAFTLVSPQSLTASRQSIDTSTNAVDVTSKSRLGATPLSSPAAFETLSPTTPTKKKTVGLITFDLDDTLYPIAPVIDEANTAFANAMARFGYATDLTPSDIVATSQEIRFELAQTDPQAAAVLTHTQVRELAIRKELEKQMLAQKLQETADDWATPVSSLANVVVAHAKKWAATAVSPSIVQAVLTAWEMERHHAAERHLYPEVVDVLTQLKQEYPNLSIGAVTDGRANPQHMTFTLAPLFDFCISWEDDQVGRRKFFTELNQVEGNAELTWIYQAALEKYHTLQEASTAIHQELGQPNSNNNNNDDKIWIHVGDDLAYDVGGSAKAGAKTIYCELVDNKYHQTARHRFEGQTAPWSTVMSHELEKRRIMNEAAKENVDQQISFLTQLPEAIRNILDREEGCI